MTNNISFLRQEGGLRVFFVGVDIVNITVDTVKLLCIILIALTIVICILVGLMILVNLIC